MYIPASGMSEQSVGCNYYPDCLSGKHILTISKHISICFIFQREREGAGVVGGGRSK